MYEGLLRSFRRLAIPEVHPRVIVWEVAGTNPGTSRNMILRTKEVKPRMLSNLYLRLRELMVRNQDEDQEGQGMVEYALILVLIAVVVIVILTVVGKQVNNVFSNISTGLGT
jgi:pilus assembly protein Flp/PilA